MKEFRRHFLSLPLMLVAFAALVTACSSDDDGTPAPPAEPDNTPSGVVAVDLGLPSGTKWANMNVGATKPEEYGDFFAWGETQGYSSASTSDGRSFDWASYKWMAAGNINKYTFADGQTDASWYDSNGDFIGDGKTVLEAGDDAATANWSSAWKVPTHAQLQELVSGTVSEWGTLNGVNGRYFYRKDGSGNKVADTYIFLPAAGYRYGTSLGNQSVYGSYWSSELNSDYSDGAWSLYFVSGLVYAGDYDSRYYGLSVRPVLAR